MSWRIRIYKYWIFGLLGFAQLSIHAQYVRDSDKHVIEVGFPNDTASYCFVSEYDLYDEGWRELPQVKFWRLVMNLDPALSVLNDAETREVFMTLSTQAYNEMKLDDRQAFKDSMKQVFDIEGSRKLYVTEGRKNYYLFTSAMPHIHRGIQLFLDETVDPWYAQAILLIESPGALRVSPVGAKGHFQLMKGLAKELGLAVNEVIDEREDFDKSARAAATFLRDVCIPEAKKMLEDNGFQVREDELWFRLFVMHLYHAGPRTMKGVLKKSKPMITGMPLIMRIWKVRYRRFGNASQNYSQIALAALMELERIVFEQGGFFIPSP